MDLTLFHRLQGQQTGRPSKPSTLYLSIDEADTHVGNKRFRLVAMVYEQNGQDLIGTTCSQPTRVMANNDMPIGAALIRLSCNRSSDCLRYSPLVAQVCKFAKACALSCMLWYTMGPTGRMFALF
ncbi:TPA: hypothetical protein ACH3X2_003226 [Trebouxia sp. C0005]